MMLFNWQKSNSSITLRIPVRCFGFILYDKEGQSLCKDEGFHILRIFSENMRNLVLCALFLLVALSEAQGNVHGPPECKKRAKQIVKSIMKVELQCSRDMLLHEKSYDDYMKHVELHDDNHMVTEETVKAAVIEKVHPEYKAKAEETVIKCLHDHNAKDIDPKDADCKGYRNVKQCIMDATADICGTAPIF